MLKHLAVIALCLIAGGASAQTNLLLRDPVSVVPGITFSLAFTDHREETTSGTSFTYNAGGDPSIGAADPNRYVVIGVMARITGGAVVSSMTVGGVGCSLVSGTAVSDGSGAMRSEIWISNSPVSSGTTATVTVNYSASITRSGIAVYRLVTGTPASTSQNTNSQTSGTSLTNTYTVPTGGTGISIVGFQTASAAITWINATLDYTVTAPSSELSSAHVTAPGSVTVTGTSSNSSGTSTMSSAAWGP